MIKLEIIKGQRGYAFDMIRDAETLGQVAFSANPDLTALFAAAPEMYELLRDVRQYVADANLRSDGYAEIDLKAIDALLAKIEGGGK